MSFLHPSLYPFSEHGLGSLLLTKIKFPKLNSCHLTGAYCMNRTPWYICEPKEWRVIVSKKQHSKEGEWKRGWSCSRGRMITQWSEPRFWGTQNWTVTLAVWPWASYILSVSHNFIIFKMNTTQTCKIKDWDTTLGGNIDYIKFKSQSQMRKLGPGKWSDFIKVTE